MDFKPNGKLHFLWTTEFFKALERLPLLKGALWEWGKFSNTPVAIRRQCW